MFIAFSVLAVTTPWQVKPVPSTGPPSSPLAAIRASAVSMFVTLLVSPAMVEARTTGTVPSPFHMPTLETPVLQRDRAGLEVRAWRDLDQIGAIRTVERRRRTIGGIGHEGDASSAQ
ncbi:MAG: hypothetical protein HY828_19500 [Actinobacteria bacterium]|nr:hypothetical protein [Actinomycetota bacterium]